MHSSTSTFDLSRVLASLLWLSGGALAALILLEVSLKALPVSTSTATGYYFDPMLLTYPARHRFTSATGWDLQNARQNQANNYGYLAEHDFVRDPNAVALIGDSYVEGSMLKPSDRFGARLERRLGRPIYAMGSPGTALLDYAERMRFASERFGVRDFVLLLERGDLLQALCGSGNVQAQCLDRQTLEPRIERQSEPSMLKSIMRRSALAQYLFSQLKVDPAGWVRSLLQPKIRGSGGAKNAIDLRIVDRVLAEFFSRTSAYRKGGKTVFVLVGEPEPRVMWWARKEGVIVVEGEPLLQAEAARTGLSMQVSPHDGHLNRLAFDVLSDAVRAAE